MKTNPLYLVCAIAAVLGQSAMAHQVQEEKLPTVQLDSDVIRLVLPSHVEVINKKKLNESAAQNIDDIALYEPGVDVKTDNMRLGHQSFSIRGIDGNRILMTIDGIPLPDEQKDLSRSGSDPVVSRDTFETDTLKSVRIVKGGNGTAQGDGAVGGSVNMRTFDPMDFVGDNNPYYFGLKYGYRSTYRSHGVTATAAMKQDNFTAMLMGTRRNMHEAKNYPAEDSAKLTERRTQSNQQDSTQENILLKAQYDQGPYHFGLTAEHFERDTKTELFDLQGATQSRSGYPLKRPVANADNIYKRDRYGLSFRATPASDAIDSASVRLYYQKLNAKDKSHKNTIVLSRDGTTEQRVNTERFDNVYEQKLVGIRPEFFKSLQMGDVQHNLSFGGEYRQTKTLRLQFQDVKDSAMGDTQNTAGYFPPSDRRQLSLYAQDNMKFSNGVNLGLGLRLEKEKSTFDFDNPSYRVSTAQDPQSFKSSSNSVLLPSIGVTVPFTENLSGSLAYRRGYRSPDVNFVGAGFANPQHGYRIIPNPDLKPESSDNFEIGINYRRDKLLINTTAFYHRYKNFISMVGAGPSNSPTYLSQWHYENVIKARTFGLEAKWAYSFTNQLKTTGALAWIKTKNQTSDTPLSTSYPINGYVGLEYAQEKFDVGAKLRFAAKNKDVLPDIPSRRGVDKYFRAPGYAVLDVVGNYQLNDNISVNAGIYNVLDKKYWISGDTKGVIDNVQKDRYTQPGRNFAIGAELKF